MSTVKVTIDGITVEVPATATILEAAIKAGVDIPYFCYHPHLKPAGICRMCLVEVEGMPKLVPACVTQVRDGMVVRTDTERVKKAREGIIEFQLLHHPLDCPICDQAGECALQDITFRYGKATSRFIEEKELYPTKFYGPLIVHEQSRCILCKRCVRFGTEVMGGTDWNVYWRAAHSIIGSYEKDVVANYFTGNMVEVCPVGAITSRLYRYKTRIWKLDFKESRCPFCELHCALDLGVREDKLYKIKHKKPEPTPWVCDKGYYAFDFVNHSERIIWPLKRSDSKMVSISQNEALALVADSLKRYAPEEIAFICGPELGCDSAFTAKSFMNTLGSQNCDYRVYGEDYVFVKPDAESLSEIENAKAISVLTSDVAMSHPVLALSVVGARLSGAEVLVVSSFDTFIGERATEFVVPYPSKEEKCVRALIEGSYSDDLGVSKEEFERAREILSRSDIVIVGVSASSSLRKFVKERLSGKKIIMLNRSANARGFTEVGFYTEGGLRSILERAVSGGIKALIVAGVDLFRSYPNYQLVKSALESLEFLVVFDLFFTDTAAYADVFLPLAAFPEVKETYCDLFGNRIAVEPAVNPLGDALPLYSWIEKLAAEMGLTLKDVEPKLEEVFFESEAYEEKAEGFDALVVFPFYRDTIYANWCSCFSAVSDVPKAYLSPDTAKKLGVSENDKVVASAGGESFEFRVKLVEWLPQRAVVLEAGFDRFPVSLLLKGSWRTKVEIKKA